MRVVPLCAVLATALTALVTRAPAHADDLARLEIIDRGTAVEVIAHGATAAAGAKLAVVRERLEIPLDGKPLSAKRSSDDPTLRRIEIRGDAPRVLSLKLRHDHARALTMAGAVTYIQLGEALHVTVPRTVAPPIAAPPAVAATAATAGAATPGATLAQLPSPPTIAAATGAGRGQPADADAIELDSPAAPVPHQPAALAAPAPAPIAGLAGASGERATSSRWWMVLAGLALIGGGAAALVHRRKQVAAPANELEIIATRSLGGKARIVWLAAGDREIVVAVSPQSVRAIGQWRRGTVPGGRSFSRVLDDASQDGELPSLARGSAADLPRARTMSGVRATPAAPPASPAVSGLLRLRERVPTVNEEVATGDDDADAQWARDSIAATGGRR